MSDEVTTQVLRRRASDQENKQRIVTGWVGLILATAACIVGLWRNNDLMAGVAFLGAMVAGNRLPFSSVRSLLPWGAKE